MLSNFSEVTQPVKGRIVISTQAHLCVSTCYFYDYVLIYSTKEETGFHLSVNNSDVAVAHTQSLFSLHTHFTPGFNLCLVQSQFQLHDIGMCG